MRSALCSPLDGFDKTIKRGNGVMKKLIAICAVILVVAVQAYGVTVVNFDDLAGGYVLTGSNYAGLTWESGNNGFEDNPGYWLVPSASSYPYSQPLNAENAWGCTLLGIGFSTQVDVSGAYFAAQGNGPLGWTNKVRVHGYRNGSEVVTTDWFTDIDKHPDWFAMNLNQVDRIVIESNPVNDGGGWYGMDNLTYDIPEPATIAMLGLGALSLIRRKK